MKFKCHEKIILIQTIILFLFFINLICSAQTVGNFTDSRDQKTYKTITFYDDLKGVDVTWMAQNLDYKTYNGCWAYENDDAYRKNMGLLYTWYEAKNVCPDGWHLPSFTEWQTLIIKFGGYDSAGKSMKSTKGWNNNGNGTNTSVMLSII